MRLTRTFSNSVYSRKKNARSDALASQDDFHLPICYLLYLTLEVLSLLAEIRFRFLCSVFLEIRRTSDNAHLDLLYVALSLQDGQPVRYAMTQLTNILSLQVRLMVRQSPVPIHPEILAFMMVSFTLFPEKVTLTASFAVRW